MSKKCKKQTAKYVQRTEKNSCAEKIVKNQTYYDPALDTIVGTSNVSQWNELKDAFCCKTNVEFATVLLNLAEEQLNNRRTSITLNAQSPTLLQQNDEKQFAVNNTEEEIEIDDFKDEIKKSTPEKCQTPPQIESDLNASFKENEVSENFNVYDINSLTGGDSEKICENLIVDKNSILMQQLFSGIRSPVKNEFEQVEIIVDDNVLQKESKVVKSKKNKSVASLEKSVNKKRKSLEVVNKKSEHDIRKAPELTVQAEDKAHMQNSELATNETDEANDDQKRVAIKIKMCSVCNTHHLQDNCTLQNAQNHILDSLTLSEWRKRYKPLLENKANSVFIKGTSDSTESNVKLSFAFLSLPSTLCIKENGNSSWCVIAKEEIRAHAQFGPLIGKIVREVDIPEDSDMRDYWEVQSERYHGFVCTESLEDSNWMRFVRPASTRHDRNVTVICKNDEIYFVTIKGLQAGDELLYWQDSTVIPNKKKMEKTTCGGCNMTFSHPLYYRLHCSVFHDVRYSLTIRKYHCKVCGDAVLGKENIMKHAIELHNGQGAYQCQFCKKVVRKRMGHRAGADSLGEIRSI